MKEARRSSLDCSSPSLGSFPDAGPSASSLANEWHRSGTSAYNIPNPLASANAPKRSRSMRPQDMNRLPSSRPTEPLPNLERHQSGRLSRKSSTRTISSSTTLTKDGFERPPSHKSRTKVNRISTLLKSKNRATTDDEGYASSSTAAIEGRRGHRSKRSLSLWSGEGILNSFDNAQGSAAQELQDRYHSQFGSEPVSRMTEKERVEHLRRTRKLVQVGPFQWMIFALSTLLIQFVLSSSSAMNLPRSCSTPTDPESGVTLSQPSTPWHPPTY